MNKNTSHLERYLDDALADIIESDDDRGLSEFFNALENGHFGVKPIDLSADIIEVLLTHDKLNICLSHFTNTAVSNWLKNNLWIFKEKPHYFKRVFCNEVNLVFKKYPKHDILYKQRVYVEDYSTLTSFFEALDLYSVNDIQQSYLKNYPAAGGFVRAGLVSTEHPYYALALWNSWTQERIDEVVRHPWGASLALLARQEYCPSTPLPSTLLIKGVNPNDLMLAYAITQHTPQNKKLQTEQWTYTEARRWLDTMEMLLTPVELITRIQKFGVDFRTDAQSADISGFNLELSV